MKPSLSLSTLATIAVVSHPVLAFSVGKLPSLGWNSWNAVGCNVNETVIMNAANAFVSLGLRDAGYQFVNIDDCWSVKNARDSQGRIQPDLTKFPDGINGLATKVHNLGLKLGIYSDAGTNTCAGYPGSLGNEAIDAATFSGWGVDYLKYDNCNVPANWTDASTYSDWSQSNSAKRYRQMSNAIASLHAGKTLVFNLCIWGTAHVTTWGAQIGESWRISGDIQSNWNSILSIINTNLQVINATNFFAHNDMDMMEIGNGALTIQEQRTHFAIWAAMKSPILLGTDLSKLSSTQVAIIKNKELLAFSQDPNVGIPAKPFSTGAAATSPPEFYAGASSAGNHVFVINTSNATATKSFRFSQVPGLNGSNGPFIVHDMWTGQDLGTFSNSFSASLATHDTGAWRITMA